MPWRSMQVSHLDLSSPTFCVSGPRVELARRSVGAREYLVVAPNSPAVCTLLLLLSTLYYCLVCPPLTRRSHFSHLFLLVFPFRPWRAMNPLPTLHAHPILHPLPPMPSSNDMSSAAPARPGPSLVSVPPAYHPPPSLFFALCSDIRYGSLLLLSLCLFRRPRLSYLYLTCHHALSPTTVSISISFPTLNSCSPGAHTNSSRRDRQLVPVFRTFPRPFSFHPSSGPVNLFTPAIRSPSQGNSPANHQTHNAHHPPARLRGRLCPAVHV